MLTRKTYFTYTIGILLIVLCTCAHSVYAQTFYLSPDTVKVTSGNEEQFDIYLMADSNITGVTSYSIYITYDKSLLALDTIIEGTFLYTCGDMESNQVWFPSRLNSDSTKLIIESGLIWPRCEVDGPGTLATIRLRNIGSGIHHFTIDSLEVYDVNADFIYGVEGQGNLALLNISPPASFNLIAPENAEDIYALADDSIQFSWESSSTPYDGDSILYTLIISDNASFTGGQTQQYTGLGGTSFSIAGSDLWNGTIYWKVRALNIYGYDTYSTQQDWSFSFTLIDSPPEPFNLVAPTNASSITLELTDSVLFDWETATTPYPGDYVRYELVISDEATFTGGTLISYDNLSETELKLDAFTLGPFSESNVYWKVRAYNTYGFERWSSQVDWSFYLEVENQPPDQFYLTTPTPDSLLNTIGKTFEYFDWTESGSSNSNDTLTFDLYIGQGNNFPGDEDFIITGLFLSETTVAIDSFSLYTPYYWRVKCTNKYGLYRWTDETYSMSFYLRGDANADANINVGDAVYLINYVFKGGPAPVALIAGDANCDVNVNVGDAVYLINYAFKGGPPPCSD